jgi:hypothetical protein
VLFFYKDDKPKGFKLLNNISKQAKFYLVCLIEIKLFGHTHLEEGIQQQANVRSQAKARATFLGKPPK